MLDLASLRLNRQGELQLSRSLNAEIEMCSTLVKGVRTLTYRCKLLSFPPHVKGSRGVCELIVLHALRCWSLMVTREFCQSSRLCVPRFDLQVESFGDGTYPHFVPQPHPMGHSPGRRAKNM